MKNVLSIIALLFLTFHFAEAQDNTTTLTVKISDLRVQKGTVYVGLYDAAENWMGKRAYSAMAKAKQDAVTVTFEDIPEGKYAISIYHDKNDNGKFDTNFLGIPAEPYAFSAGAKGRFGPPSWERAAFQVAGPKSSHEIAF
ncbi:MAG TPA: DUF2141 domain-containing protein [Saprospiraceae bacterium]|nr:DUF2141 domain-containing protein [Saprospiraceae bacterium]